MFQAYTNLHQNQQLDNFVNHLITSVTNGSLTLPALHHKTKKHLLKSGDFLAYYWQIFYTGILAGHFQQRTCQDIIIAFRTVWWFNSSLVGFKVQFQFNNTNGQCDFFITKGADGGGDSGGGLELVSNFCIKMDYEKLLIQNRIYTLAVSHFIHNHHHQDHDSFPQSPIGRLRDRKQRASSAGLPILNQIQLDVTIKEMESIFYHGFYSILLFVKSNQDVTLLQSLLCEFEGFSWTKEYNTWLLTFIHYLCTQQLYVS